MPTTHLTSVRLMSCALFLVWKLSLSPLFTLLAANGGAGNWRSGWSWDINVDNRYLQGPPVVDKDTDNDVVPDSWGAGGVPFLEGQAGSAETISNGTNAGIDWGMPGKQFMTADYND